VLIKQFPTHPRIQRRERDLIPMAINHTRSQEGWTYVHICIYNIYYIVTCFCFPGAEVEYAPVESCPTAPADNQQSGSSESDNGDDEEDSDKLNPGQSESLLIPEDEMDDLVIKIVPAEGNQPMSVAFGDFNLDSLSDFRLLKTFLGFGMKEYTTVLPSTDYGRKLDACFSNIREVDAWFYESLCPDHKPICSTLPKNAPLHLFSPIELDMFERDLERRTIVPPHVQLASINPLRIVSGNPCNFIHLHSKC